MFSNDDIINDQIDQLKEDIAKAVTLEHFKHLHYAMKIIGNYWCVAGRMDDYHEVYSLIAERQLKVLGEQPKDVPPFSDN